MVCHIFLLHSKGLIILASAHIKGRMLFDESCSGSVHFLNQGTLSPSTENNTFIRRNLTTNMKTHHKHKRLHTRRENEKPCMDASSLNETIDALSLNESIDALSLNECSHSCEPTFLHDASTQPDMGSALLTLPIAVLFTLAVKIIFLLFCVISMFGHTFYIQTGIIITHKFSPLFANHTFHG